MNAEIIDSPGKSIDLSTYVNKFDLDIKIEATKAIGQQIVALEQKNSPIGKRIDGSKQNSNAVLIGLVAEKSVFDLLSKKYSSTEWVSKNAAKAGVNPEGSDSNGCDITFVDELNEIHYIEVKGKADGQNHFYISYQEYSKAKKEEKSYHILFVKHTLDNDKREIIDIGTSFYLKKKIQTYSIIIDSRQILKV